MYDAANRIGKVSWPYTTGCAAAPAKRRFGRVLPMPNNLKRISALPHDFLTY